MSTYYLTVPLEYTQGYYEIQFSQLSPHYVGELKFIETGGSSTPILNFSNLTKVDENTFTTTDEEGNTHTLVFTYNDDGSIKTATYDGKNVAITYDSDGNLVEVGNSDIDVSLYPDPEPSGNIGYQVTFKVEGNDYYVAQCLQGESITEPPTPTMQGGTFGSWQLNGVDVSFPYTPSADVEVVAVVSTYHTEIEVVTAGTALYTYSSGTITKLNNNTDDNITVFGYCAYNNDTQKFLFLVSKVASNTRMSGNEMSLATEKAFTYNGETWYYSHSNATATTNIDHACAALGDLQDVFSGNPAAVAAGILNYYFNIS